MNEWGNTDPAKLLAAAKYYGRYGWRVIPCAALIGGKCDCNDETKHDAGPKDWGKHPRINAWQNNSSSDEAQIESWWAANPESNVGIHCEGSGLIVIDIDPRNGGDESFDVLESRVGGLPATVEAYTGEYNTRAGVRRGRHLYFKVQDGESFKTVLRTEGLPGIDVKHKGYVIAPPSRHGSGLVYEWRPGHAPWDMYPVDAPDELLAEIRKRPRRLPGTGTEFGVMEVAGEKVDVDALLAEGIQEGEREVTLYRLACAFANQYPVASEHGKASVRAIMRGINAKYVNPPLDYDDSMAHQVERAIEFVLENPKSRMFETPEIREYREKAAEWLEAQAATPVTPGPVGTVAEAPAPESPAVGDGTAGAPAGGSSGGGGGMPGGSDAGMPLPPDLDDPFRSLLPDENTSGIAKRTLTDVGNGRRFADYWGTRTKYSVGLGWFCWDGSYWAPDGGMTEVAERAKNLFSITTREAMTYTDPDKQENVMKFAMACKSNARLGSAVTSAQTDPRVVVGVEEWDADDYLLGVKNGVVDLRTGALVSGDPRQYITKRCRVKYTPGMRNVRFEQFLDFATEGDREFQEWLQRAAGLTLSGVREQDVLFLVFGKPGTGKNTLVEALFLLLDKYSYSLDSDLLLARRQPSQQDMYQYAEMLGKRMLWVDELPEAERLKDDKVKKLTGSETMEGRSPGEKPITFKSHAKLWISTNHQPPIRDDAMWRRLRPIPFQNVPERPDPTLKPYIFDPEGALPAVLSWAVEGAVKYFGSPSVDGLGWCKRVWDATEVYRKQEDTIGLFLSEETKVSPGAEVSVQVLYSVYKAWAEDRGERPMTRRPFVRELQSKDADAVVGDGNRAMLKDRQLVPRIATAPPGSGGGDWDALISRAR